MLNWTEHNNLKIWELNQFTVKNNFITNKQVWSCNIISLKQGEDREGDIGLLVENNFVFLLPEDWMQWKAPGWEKASDSQLRLYSPPSPPSHHSNEDPVWPHWSPTGPHPRAISPPPPISWGLPCPSLQSDPGYSISSLRFLIVNKIQKFFSSPFFIKKIFFLLSV